MITPTKAYAASDGSLHATLEAAQAQSLTVLFSDLEQTPCQATMIAKRILDNRAQVLDILTTTKRSRPGRRVVNGYRSKRTAVPTQSTAA